MSVKGIMTKQAEYVERKTSIQEAAQRMRDLDCGFLPVADKEKDKLCGVITDRDITIRAVAEGLDLNQTPVEEIISEKVLYCYEDDDIEHAANCMRDQGVYRLVVLNNDKDKRLAGILSLGDIVRSGQTTVAKETSDAILGSPTMV